MNRIALALAASLTIGTFAACVQYGPSRDDAPVGGPNRTPSKDLSLTIYSIADAATFDPRSLLASKETADPFEQGDMNNYMDTLIPGFAVVRDTRTVELHKGVNNLEFRGIPAGIDTTSVLFESLTDPDSVTLASIHFAYDLLNSDALLKKGIGQNVIVTIENTNPAAMAHGHYTGTLLSVDANNLTLRTADPAHPIQIISRSNYITGVALAENNVALVTQPELNLTVDAKKGGRRDVRIIYHTRDVTWRADYNLTFTNEKDQQADFRGSASLLNQSTADYADANVELAAGDVRRFSLQPPQVFAGGIGAGAFLSQYFKENPPYEAHIYSVEPKITLADQSIAQVALFDARTDIRATKGYAYDHSADTIMRYGFGPWSSVYTQAQGGAVGGGLFPQPGDQSIPTSHWIAQYNLLVNPNVDAVIKIANTAKNHLGIPLPAGRVREYQQQPSGREQFIGEDVIDHVAPGDTFSIRAGIAPDITPHAEIMDSQWNDNGTPRKITYKIVLRNQKAQRVTVDVREHLYPGPQWWISDKTDPYEIINSSTIFFPIDIPANGERTMYYTVNYNYARTPSLYNRPDNEASP